MSLSTNSIFNVLVMMMDHWKISAVQLELSPSTFRWNMLWEGEQLEGSWEKREKKITEM
jgi:hypothetical protein